MRIREAKAMARFSSQGRGGIFCPCFCVVWSVPKTGFDLYGMRQQPLSVLVWWSTQNRQLLSSVFTAFRAVKQKTNRFPLIQFVQLDQFLLLTQWAIMSDTHSLMEMSTSTNFLQNKFISKEGKKITNSVGWRRQLLSKRNFLEDLKRCCGNRITCLDMLIQRMGK